MRLMDAWPTLSRTAASRPDRPAQDCALSCSRAGGNGASRGRAPAEALSENLRSPPANAGGPANADASISRECRAIPDAPPSEALTAKVSGATGYHAAARVKSVLPVKPDQLALNLDPVRRQDADFIGSVGRLQRDRGAAAAEPLQRRFLFVDQRHHDIAGLGGLVALDQRHVAVENPGIHHGIAAHLQGVVLSGTEHVRWHADGVTSGLQRLNRCAGGDAAHDRHGHRTVAIVLGTDAGAAADPAERALDDAGRKTAAAVAATTGRKLGQLDDLDGAGAIGKAANEAALFKGCDEAMDPGLRAQIQRILHLVEGGRNAGFLQAFADESQEFVLFARKHLDQSPGLTSFDSETRELAIPNSKRLILETNHERTLYVPYVFRNHLILRQRTSFA